MNSLATSSGAMRTVRWTCYLLLIVVCTACSLQIVEPAAGTEPRAAAPAMTGDTAQSEIQNSLLHTGGYVMARPDPPTLEGLLKDIKLIVMARIGDVKYSKFYGFDPETGEPIVPTGEEAPYGSFGVADFTLEVEEVFWADAAYRPDEPLVLKTLWSDDLSDEGVKAFKESLAMVGLKPFATGDRYLFLLSRNPDGTYGAGYEEQRLTVGEDGILYYSQMYLTYTGEFSEGDLAGEAKGPPLTVDDLVRAAEAMTGELGAGKSDLNDAHYTIYLPLTPAQ